MSRTKTATPHRAKTAPRSRLPKTLVWEHVLDSLQEGVIAFDDEGNVLAMNQAAEQLTARSFGSAVGRHHTHVFRGSAWVSELIDQVFRGDRGGIRADGELTGLWERSVAVRASASPTVDVDGRSTGVALILQDLTVQTDLEADEHRARSLSSLGDVVAGLAHEIKNPLSGIRGAVQLLAREVSNVGDASEYIALVLREVDRLNGLVEQLLQLGARGRLETSGVNIHEVIEQVVAVAAREPGAEDVRVARFFDPSLPLVRGHRDSLVQVFLNLIRNSMQAMAALPASAPRELRLSTKIETDFHFETIEGSGAGRMRFLRVDVEDSGAGIAADVRANVFSPFVTTKPKGTGLGLAISHRIVSEVGGTIRFESEPGRTVFRVILPVFGERSE